MSGLFVPGQRPSPERLYALMDRQVRSYHKYRRMGENTSVPLELARELLESLDYTLELGGGSLEAGQAQLEQRLRDARALLELVMGTCPRWQTECRWEALSTLRRYLEGYDHLHLAHKGPEDLFYPILIRQPEGLRGIDQCLFQLRILWYENQILAGAEALGAEELWDLLPRETMNQCEQLLINGVGKALLYPEPVKLTFREEERALLREAPSEGLPEALEEAALRLCRWLELRDPNAAAYGAAIVPPLRLRLENGAWTEIFL